MSIRLWVGVMFACWAWLGSAGAAENAQSVVSAHAAAVERIRTIHFEFAIKNEQGGGVVTVKGECWKSSDSKRLKYDRNGMNESVYVLPDRVITVINGAGRGGESHALIVPNTGVVFLDVYPWRDSLYAMDSSQGRGTQPLAEQLQGHLDDAKLESRDGKVVFKTADGTTEIHFDTRHNYLVSRKYAKVMLDSGGKTVPFEVDETVLGFGEVAPGIYFPKKVVVEERLSAKLKVRRTTLFKVREVNEPIPPKVLRPKYRDGTLVKDQISGTEYRADPTGLAKGPQRPLSKVAAGPRSAQADAEPALPSTSEADRWGWWILPAGLNCLFFGGSVYAWRFVRRRRGEEAAG